MEPQSNPSQPVEPTSSLKVALAWLYVGVPLLWGVSQTFIKALALFQ